MDDEEKNETDYDYFNTEGTMISEKLLNSTYLLKTRICKGDEIIRNYIDKNKECLRLQEDIKMKSDSFATLQHKYDEVLSTVIKIRSENAEYKKEINCLNQKVKQFDDICAADKQHIQQLKCKITDLEEKHRSVLLDHGLEKSLFQDQIKELEKELKSLRKSQAQQQKKYEKMISNIEPVKSKCDIGINVDILEDKSTSDKSTNVDFTEKLPNKPPCCDIETDTKCLVGYSNKATDTSCLTEYCSKETDTKSLIKCTSTGTDAFQPSVSEKSTLTEEFYHLKDDPYPLFCSQCENKFESSPIKEICKLMCKVPDLLENINSPEPDLSDKNNYEPPVITPAQNILSQQPMFYETVDQYKSIEGSNPSFLSLMQLQNKISKLEKSIKKQKQNQYNMDHCCHHQISSASMCNHQQTLQPSTDIHLMTQFMYKVLELNMKNQSQSTEKIKNSKKNTVTKQRKRKRKRKSTSFNNSWTIEHLTDFTDDTENEERQNKRLKINDECENYAEKLESTNKVNLSNICENISTVLKNNDSDGITFKNTSTPEASRVQNTLYSSGTVLTNPISNLTLSKPAEKDTNMSVKDRLKLYEAEVPKAIIKPSDRTNAKKSKSTLLKKLKNLKRESKVKSSCNRVKAPLTSSKNLIESIIDDFSSDDVCYQTKRKRIAHIRLPLIENCFENNSEQSSITTNNLNLLENISPPHQLPRALENNVDENEHKKPLVSNAIDENLTTTVRSQQQSSEDENSEINYENSILKSPENSNIILADNVIEHTIDDCKMKTDPSSSNKDETTDMLIEQCKNKERNETLDSSKTDLLESKTNDILSYIDTNFALFDSYDETKTNSDISDGTPAEIPFTNKQVSTNVSEPYDFDDNSQTQFITETSSIISSNNMDLDSPLSPTENISDNKTNNTKSSLNTLNTNYHKDYYSTQIQSVDSREPSSQIIPLICNNTNMQPSLMEELDCQETDTEKYIVYNSNISIALKNYIDKDKPKKSNVIKKTKAIRKLEEVADKFVDQQLTRYTNNSEWDNAIFLDVLENLTNKSTSLIIAKSILKIIVQKTEHNQTLDKTYTPPAPLLTNTQQKIVTLLISLQTRFTDIIRNVQNSIECRLFNFNDSPEVEDVEIYVRLYTALARIQKDREKVRIFCCDAMYALKYKAFAIIFTVLTCWPEVLPSYSSSTDLLVKCIVHSIMTHPNMKPQSKLIPLRIMLVQWYKYQSTGYSSTELIKELLNSLQDECQNGIDTAIILLAKREGIEWTYKNVIKGGLLQIIVADKHPCTYRAFFLLGALLRPFPVSKEDTTVSDIVDQLCDLMESGQGSDDRKEGIAAALLLLAKHNFSKIAKAIMSWTPSKTLRPKTIQQFNEFFESKSNSFWKNFYKQNVEKRVSKIRANVRKLKM